MQLVADWLRLNSEYIISNSEPWYLQISGDLTIQFVHDHMNLFRGDLFRCQLRLVSITNSRVIIDSRDNWLLCQDQVVLFKCGDSAHVNILPGIWRSQLEFPLERRIQQRHIF